MHHSSLPVLQVLHGITVRSFERKKERLLIGSSKIFGVPLENVPRNYIPEFGLVPCFLVDACSFLLERAATVGLFRKPGSIPRIKSLRINRVIAWSIKCQKMLFLIPRKSKLNSGNGSLCGALSYDVATLIKQFCRELPEPLFPSELHESLLKAQSLTSVQDRTSALQLLSCLLPARNASCLHYLFNFLSKVSQRCSENLMTSSNLATVFAPCLLPPPNKAEMSEGRLELRVLVLGAFIENPHLFGVIPKAVMDSVEFLLNFSCPKSAPSKKGQRKRQSFKVIRSVKTAPWNQGKSKVTPTVSEPSQVSTSGVKQTLRRSVGLATFPNVLLFRTCTATDVMDCSSPIVKASRTPQDRLFRRDVYLDYFHRLSRGRDSADDLPVLAAAGKLQLTPWRRRSSL
ncbi:rho GTPase-activating protein 11A-like isoform X2 [Solea solea]|uniref:rho GTPase-activating protein 11A-like isoform X2 n=1 Tax=Solea solea TaxID=90069 RepID=UPI00272C4EAB|nr:rho GTPase-activating protein 11A-like isoform X2 [Solea solea]